MRTILVTGSSGGIGQATANAFLKAGYSVVGLDRMPPEYKDPAFAPHCVDLTDAEAVENILADVGPLTHVVATAGGALALEKVTPDLDRLPIEEIRSSIEQNLITTFVTLRAALPGLRLARGDRSVSLTSSTDALVSNTLPAYAAAKAGIIGLVRSLTQPLGREGIRINAIAPGDIPTARNRREWAHIPDWYDRLSRQSALERLVTAEEIASSFLALATALTSMSGQVLVIDAGQTANAVML